ncbi:hypothetical protein [Plastoroseomonas hellenica]|uniref:hypothetical protein n=1 Tax=Plastoroseomonas hellenica TaxID=2687306 RepID=UPI001BAB16AC|nr:hypothetical protein [Plastoroseomonas hellenica]
MGVPSPGLFGVIERLQGGMPWGSVLDAGTGARSAGWVSGLPSLRWTGVSADPDLLAKTRAAVAHQMRAGDRLIAGNWADPALLAGEAHDTVIAEYLLGALEAHAPYFQENLFLRLRPLVRRRLYVIGLDPYVAGRPGDAAGRLVQEIGRFRDACHLLAGETPYREYPAEWVADRLAGAGLRIRFAQRFPNHYDMRWVELQIATASALIARTADAALAKALAGQAAELRRHAQLLCDQEGGLVHGHDYLIAAEPG